MSDKNSMPAEADDHRDKRQKFDEYADIDRRINNDEDVLAWRRDYGKHLPQLSYLELLFIIKEQSGREESENLRLISKKQDLVPKILASWECGSYREVLESGYFRMASPPVQPTMSGPQELVSKNRWYEQPLREAWETPFQGNYHKVLFANINMMYRSKPHENICAVVQSSGTGKSRMVDEQAKLVYTLPINIRNDDRPVAAYPPADRALHEHLVNHAPMNIVECQAHYVKFFQSLFLHAAEELSSLDLSNNDLAGEWYKKMASIDYRRKFYGDVVKLCNRELRPDAQEVLTSKLNELCQTADKIKILIYIDEAHELEDKVENRTKLDIMCSVISNFCKSPLFCLLLSTQSSIGFLAPARKAVISERAKEAELLAPITETPFDCAPGIKVKGGVLCVTDLYEPGRMTKWGRPFWWTAGCSIQDLLELARVKLLCHHNIGMSYRDTARPALTAVLDVLLAFHFEPERTYIEDIQAELVKSHMRIAYSVPSHRMYFRSGYSSEPLLAEAAAQQLWAFLKLEQSKEQTTSFGIMKQILKKTRLADHSLIDLGQRGELVMRMFLTCAYMDGVLADLGDQASEPGIVFSRGCSLLTFIQELFKAEQAKKILEAVPDNLKDETTFSQSFTNSMVRFTHFVKAGDEYVLTSRALCAAFVRGAAIIGHQSQKHVDFVIPILLDQKAVVRESHISALLIQVKRRIKGSGPTKFTFTQRDVNLFPANENEEARKRPYIVLVAELGITPEVGKVGKIDTPCVHVLPQPTKKKYPKDTHPRYNFVAYGGSIYKNVTADECLALLATGNFVDEHPREDSRDLVMRLKPFWKEGKDTFHWYESEDEA